MREALPLACVGEPPNSRVVDADHAEAMGCLAGGIKVTVTVDEVVSIVPAGIAVKELGWSKRRERRRPARVRDVDRKDRLSAGGKDHSPGHRESVRSASIGERNRAQDSRLG